MARVAYEVVHKQVTGNDDNKKIYWQRRGVIFENEVEGVKRLSLRLNMMSIGSNGSFYLFPPKERSGKGNNQDYSQSQNQETANYDIEPGQEIDLSEIPF